MNVHAICAVRDHAMDTVRRMLATQPAFFSSREHATRDSTFATGRTHRVTDAPRLIHHRLRLPGCLPPPTGIVTAGPFASSAFASSASFTMWILRTQFRFCTRLYAVWTRVLMSAVESSAVNNSAVPCATA